MLMTVVLVLHIIARELRMPCEPMPDSLKPWKGKWSGPRDGGPFTCTHTTNDSTIVTLHHTCASAGQLGCHALFSPARSSYGVRGEGGGGITDTGTTVDRHARCCHRWAYRTDGVWYIHRKATCGMEATTKHMLLWHVVEFRVRVFTRSDIC